MASMLSMLFLVSALLTLSTGSVLPALPPQNHGHMPNPNAISPSHVRTPLPRSSVLPKNFSWRDVNGTNYLTILRNQHVPTYCGSCWAFAATSSLSDRIKIARRARWPDVSVSPQMLISCGPGHGCHGAGVGDAYDFIRANYITDETCSIYRARGHDNGVPCSALETCEDCKPSGKCFRPKKFLKYTVDEFGRVEGDTVEEQEQNMMQEIYNRGPIACGMAVTLAMENYTGPGVFTDTSGYTQTSHDVSIFGFGVDENTGEKFWHIRNSWGQYWGDGGFFKLRRGINNLAIEGGKCFWATPLDTWSEHEEQSMSSDKASSSPLLSSNLISTDLLSSSLSKLQLWSPLRNLMAKITHNSFLAKHYAQPSRRAGPKSLPDANISSVILTPRPQDTVKDEEVPEKWDWRDVNGTNYLSWNVNQHIPVYCGSCWAQGPTSALADRFIIADRNKYENLALAVQALINCPADHGGCNGGDPITVYKFAHSFGMPHVTCQPYEARNPVDYEDACEELDLRVCRDCGWPPPQNGSMGHCWPKEKYDKFYAAEFGTLSGVMDMKKEIFKRGPIACGMDATLRFDDYSGGIYSQTMEPSSLVFNHEISIVGWDRDERSGQDFWIGRNSWGTYWGEAGFFRIQMHEDNLGIETQCIWAVPKL